MLVEVLLEKSYSCVYSHVSVFESELRKSLQYTSLSSSLLGSASDPNLDLYIQ